MKVQFLIEFLSILSWRLSFLAGELPQQLSVPEGEEGEGGCHDVCKSKITQKYVIKNC